MSVRHCRWPATIASAIVAVVVASSAAAQPCGDADESGTVTVTDGVQTLRASAGLPSLCIVRHCDLDANGAVTVTDGVAVLRVAAGLPATQLCPTARCGNGVVDDASEDCDGAEDSACPERCNAACRCTPAPTPSPTALVTPSQTPLQTPVPSLACAALEESCAVLPCCLPDLACSLDAQVCGPLGAICPSAYCACDYPSPVYCYPAGSACEDDRICDERCGCVAFDTDGDGVPYTRDRCRATPAGEAVDLDGCARGEFCSRIEPPFDGADACRAADWLSDEPNANPGDCDVLELEGGSSLCVAA